MESAIIQYAVESGCPVHFEPFIAVMKRQIQQIDAISTFVHNTIQSPVPVVCATIEHGMVQ